MILQELEFLTDSSVISPQQLSSILAQLPAQTPLHAPLYTPITGSSPTPPTNLFSNINLNEKANYGVATNPAPPPPAYASGPQILSIAAALYAYTPTDAGDLALQQNDRIQVTEHMNNDCKPCARPFSRKRSWILIQIPQGGEGATNELVSKASSQEAMSTLWKRRGRSTVPTEGRKPSKFEENGKKFGKKMGNAAIFGAGATIGSNIVNGIF
jgi:hypothetical protein